jgi:hypothetical protein
VPGVARLPDQTTGLGLDLFTVREDTYSTFEDETELILPRVSVQRSDERARRRVVLDERQAAVGVRGSEQEPVLGAVRGP